MQRVRADHRLGRERHVRRHDDEGAVLPAAQAAVAPDEALEGGDLLGAGLDQAVDVDVGRFRAERRTQDEGRCVRPERCQRVGSLDVTVCEPVRSLGAQCDGPGDLVQYDREADTRMGGQRATSAGNRSSSCWRVSRCRSPRT